MLRGELFLSRALLFLQGLRTRSGRVCTACRRWGRSSRSRWSRCRLSWDGRDGWCRSRSWRWARGRSFRTVVDGLPRTVEIPPEAVWIGRDQFLRAHRSPFGFASGACIDRLLAREVFLVDRLAVARIRGGRFLMLCDAGIAQPRFRPQLHLSVSGRPRSSHGFGFVRFEFRRSSRWSWRWHEHWGRNPDARAGGELDGRNLTDLSSQVNLDFAELAPAIAAGAVGLARTSITLPIMLVRKSAPNTSCSMSRRSVHALNSGYGRPAARGDSRKLISAIGMLVVASTGCSLISTADNRPSHRDVVGQGKPLAGAELLTVEATSCTTTGDPSN